MFGYGRKDIAAAIEALLNNAAYAADGRKAVVSALDLFRTGRADFSDCLIVARARLAGCGNTATLDKAMKGLPDVVLI